LGSGTLAFGQASDGLFGGFLRMEKVRRGTFRLTSEAEPLQSVSGEWFLGFGDGQPQAGSWQGPDFGVVDPQSGSVAFEDALLSHPAYPPCFGTRYLHLGAGSTAFMDPITDRATPETRVATCDASDPDEPPWSGSLLKCWVVLDDLVLSSSPLSGTDASFFIRAWDDTEDADVELFRIQKDEIQYYNETSNQYLSALTIPGSTNRIVGIWVLTVVQKETMIITRGFEPYVPGAPCDGVDPMVYWIPSLRYPSPSTSQEFDQFGGIRVEVNTGDLWLDEISLGFFTITDGGSSF
jgi:hypothetical protein